MTQTTDSAQNVQPMRRGPGRPRHPDTEARAYRAVLELFGQKGWSGVSLDAVATRAGIGKSSIYLRWHDKRELLLDAIRDLEAHHVNPQTEGLSIRDYLVAHARARAELLLGEHGPAIANIVSAAVANPEAFGEIRDESVSRGVLGLEGRIQQAMTDGELPPSTSSGHLLDAIEGAIFFHVLMTGAGTSKEELRPGLGEWVTELVDMVLRGATVSR
jgi:AcrR family transcriptional regulator